MRRITSIYLAGPDVWYPDATALLRSKRELCERAGFIGVTGREGRLVETEPSEAMAREIYADTLIRLRSCEAVIANLTPWRGPGCDAGTAFELGFAAALGLPIFGYLNLASEAEADYATRVDAYVGATPDETGRWRDPDGCEVEDFGLPEGLMLWAEARRVVAIVTPDPWGDLAGLDACLDAVGMYSD